MARALPPSPPPAPISSALYSLSSGRTAWVNDAFSLFALTHLLNSSSAPWIDRLARRCEGFTDYSYADGEYRVGGGCSDGEWYQSPHAAVLSQASSALSLTGITLQPAEVFVMRKQQSLSGVASGMIVREEWEGMNFTGRPRASTHVISSFGSSLPNLQLASLLHPSLSLTFTPTLASPVSQLPPSYSMPRRHHRLTRRLGHPVGANGSFLPGLRMVSTDNQPHTSPNCSSSLLFRE